MDKKAEEYLKEIRDTVIRMHEGLHGEFGLINRVKENEKEVESLVSDIREIKDYITRQKIYSGVIGTIAGALAALGLKILAYLWKL
jgi:tetrahydromethanopterin S-methyltransferase subunit F